MASVERKRGRLRMLASPLAPCRRDYGEHGQLKSRADERANYRRPIQGGPEAAGLGIEHEFVRSIQQAARAERAHSAADATVVRNHRAAQRAVDERQLEAAQ